MDGSTADVVKADIDANGYVVGRHLQLDAMTSLVIMMLS